ncbi:MAG TPA: amidohydrolase family protein [Acidimicrobiales bacterium]|nr:amidohydrolase family protein [Acidimicrobiales bacterium]
MADLLVRGGTVVDGTGAESFRADVRVRAGRIVEVGRELSPAGEPQLDADGALVAPGFIDNHTHFDFQLFWDGCADPMPQHGVTTLLIGNCSLSLFPVREPIRRRLTDAFCFIEDLPTESVDAAVPWGWESYAQYRDALSASGLGVNVQALVGHTALRMYVMGDDAWERAATATECARMAQVLDESLHAGAYGLSTSFFDQDAERRPVPSRHADDAEFASLLDVVARYPQRFVEFIPDVGGADPRADIERLAALAGPRGVLLTWNGLFDLEYAPDVASAFLEQNRRLTASGVQIYPMMSPRSLDLRVNWDQSMLFMGLPSWNRFVQARGDAKRALIEDPQWRAAARTEWDAADNAMFPFRRLERIRLVEVAHLDNERWLRRSLADLRGEHGGHPSDVLADWVAANDMRPGVVVTGIGNGESDGVARLLAEPGLVVGAGDAGAHVQMQCTAGDTTLLLTRHVRERGDLGLEQAVHALTGRQAALFGLHDRGLVTPGMAADLTVFALDELEWAEDVFVADLPAGMRRLRRPPGGYRATVVAGEAVQIGGELTTARRGRVLHAAETVAAAR